MYTSGGVEDPGPQRPFVMVHMGIEQTPLGMPASSRTLEIPFDVVVHDNPGTMLDIDDACVIVKDSLPAFAPAVVGAMSVYEVKYEETSRDLWDDHFKTNTRRVSFRMMTRR